MAMEPTGNPQALAAAQCVAAPPTPRTAQRVDAAAELTRRALRGSAWTVVGHAAGQGIRFANNLCLTWLIAPDLLGLMSTVHAFLAGLQLMSDFGIGPALIQSRHGHQRRFQDTAWTLHVVRGAVLWLCTLPLGPLLASIYAGQPGAEHLTWLVPVAGTTALIAGPHSTAIYMRNRDLDLRPVVLLDIGAQLAGCAVGLLWAWRHPGLWALVAGVLVHQIVHTAASWSLGPRNRLRWDREAVAAVVRFGRWIWLSTMLTWVAAQLDRLVLPRLLGFDGLAIYQVALMIAVAIPETVHVLGSRILFPALSDLARRREPALAARLGKARLLLLLPAVGALVLLGLAGELLVELLYPDAFHGAGWMLRLLAAAAIPQTLTASSWYAFFAIGRSFVPMCLQAARLLLKGAAMVCGYHLDGLRGVILGLVAAEFAHYPLVATALWRHGMFQPRLDLPVLLGSAAAIAVGLWAW